MYRPLRNHVYCIMAVGVMGRRNKDTHPFFLRNNAILCMQSKNMILFCTCVCIMSKSIISFRK